MSRRAREKKNSAQGLSRTGTCLFPRMTRHRQRHVETPICGQDGQDGHLVARQYCMSRAVPLIGPSSRRPGTLHVARWSLLVARRSSLAASGAGPTASHPASQSVSVSLGQSTGFQGLQAQNTQRSRCSYMCFITWTIVVLMSNSNNRPVATTTFSQPASLSAARTLRWNLETAPQQHSQSQQGSSLVATPVQRPDKRGCKATLPCHRAIMGRVVGGTQHCTMGGTVPSSKCILRPPPSRRHAPRPACGSPPGA